MNGGYDTKILQINASESCNWSLAIFFFKGLYMIDIGNVVFDLGE